eukprot:s2195_g5.t1
MDQWQQMSNEAPKQRRDSNRGIQPLDLMLTAAKKEWHRQMINKRGACLRAVSLTARGFSAKLCQAVPSCATMCQAVPRCAKLCQALPSCAKMCQAVPSSAKLCQALPSCAKMCQAWACYSVTAKFCNDRGTAMTYGANAAETRCW